MNDGHESGDAGDISRRQHLRAMIGAAQSAAAGARSRGGPRASRTQATGPPTGAIAGYELLGELHRGGQGVVYQGIQESTQRKVAIKIMKEGPFAGSADRTRFEREIRILGALQDRRIVAIHNSGSAAGSQYFVMDYIAGAPLDVHFAGRAATVREIITLFVQICEAINTAHLLGIVHRDLKPGNILIDDAGAPHILDFGLAKSIAGGVRGRSLASMTVTGQFVGSMPWAAPEQVRGEGLITPRTDVYSLGVLLYQVLTNRFPYPIVGGLDQILRNIQNTEPVRPCTIRRDIDDELETIVLKCLAKEPERRYASAGAMGQDLEFYLKGEPIDAKRASGWYLLRKTIRRYRKSIVVVATFTLLVTASAISLSVLYSRQGVLLKDISRERDKAILAEKAEKQGRKRAEYESYLANISAADAALMSADGGAALRRLAEAPESLRNWEWRFLSRAADPSIATIRGPQNRDLKHLSFSPSGRFLAGLAYKPNTRSELQVWDRLASTPVLTVPIGDDYAVPYFVGPYQFTDADNRLRVCPGDGSVVEYDLENGSEVSRSTIAGAEPKSLIWMAAPHVFVNFREIESQWSVHFWNDSDDTVHGQFLLDANNWIAAAVASSDGKQFAVAQVNGVVHLCEIAPLAKPVSFMAHDTQIYGMAFNRNGSLLATAAEDGLIKLWSLKGDDSAFTKETVKFANDVREVRSFRGSSQRVFSIVFSPDGSTLAAGAADKTLRTWNVHDGSQLRTFMGHAGMVSAVAFHPDGKRMVSGAYDETIKLWDPTLPTDTMIRRNLPGIVNVVNFDADGTRLMVGTKSGAMVLDPVTGGTINDVSDTQDAGFSLFDSTGSRAVVGHHDGTVRIVDLKTGHETIRFKVALPSATLRLAIDPSGTQLACTDLRERFVTLHDLVTGVELYRLEHLAAGIAIAYSPIGSRLATASRAGELSLWDNLNGREVWSAHDDYAPIMSIAFSPDGKRLATASEDSTISLRDARDGQVQMKLRPQLGDVWCEAFSPDGTRLAAGGRDRTVRVFDAGTGYEVLSLRGLTGTVQTIAFSPDGRRIAAGSWSREVFVWDSGPDELPSTQSR